MNLTHLPEDMLVTRDDGQKYPGFHSFKTTKPVRYPRRWFRDALILSTFDESISAIAPDALRQQARDGTGVFTYLIYDRGGRAHLMTLYSDEAPLASTSGHQGQAIFVPRWAVHNHPHLTVAKSIWAHKRASVDIGDQLRVMSAAFPGPITLGQAMSLCRNEKFEPAGQVLGMIANGTLGFALGRHLDSRTLVWTREGADVQKGPDIP